MKLLWNVYNEQILLDFRLIDIIIIKNTGIKKRVNLSKLTTNGVIPLILGNDCYTYYK